MAAEIERIIDQRIFLQCVARALDRTSRISGSGWAVSPIGAVLQGGSYCEGYVGTGTMEKLQGEGSVGGGAGQGRTWSREGCVA